MAKRGTKKPDWSGAGKLPAPACEFVLRAIADYRTNEWIVDELLKRYGIRRSPISLQYYRHGKRWEAQLRRYRQHYDEQLGDEPMASKRYLLACLHEAFEIAGETQDVQVVLAITRQAARLSGWHLQSL